MLDLGVIKKIEDFVSKQPRSIQEISLMLKKNWRTADRYIDYIIENFGTISTRTFRKGTRGALKVVYWSSVSKNKDSIFQEQLTKQIELFRTKEQFSAFDIYQHIDNKNKTMSVEKQINLKEMAKFIKQTKKQLLVFTGNLSWINLKNKDINLFKCLEYLLKKNISIKVISRVDLASFKNIKKLLDLNFKYGKELIEIRHREHPIRGFVSDNKNVRIKEIKESTGKINELNKELFVFYTFNDKNWTEWLSKRFWNLFSQSIDAKKRMDQIKDFI